MFNLCLVLYSALLVISKTLANPPDRNIFNKFQQSDFKLKFEHVDVVSFNRQIARRFEITTFKHNRTCAAVNMTFQFNIDVGNKLELIIQAYKFASNEYRQFPLRFQVNLCFAITKNLIGAADMMKCGNCSECPLQKEKIYHGCNWKPNESKFPPYIPSGRYMVEAQMLYGSIETAVVHGYGEIYRPIPIPH